MVNRSSRQPKGFLFVCFKFTVGMGATSGNSSSVTIISVCLPERYQQQFFVFGLTTQTVVEHSAGPARLKHNLSENYYLKMIISIKIATTMSKKLNRWHNIFFKQKSLYQVRYKFDNLTLFFSRSKFSCHSFLKCFPPAYRC